MMLLYQQTSNPQGSSDCTLSISDNSRLHYNPIQFFNCSCCVPSTSSHSALPLWSLIHWYNCIYLCTENSPWYGTQYETNRSLRWSKWNKNNMTSCDLCLPYSVSKDCSHLKTLSSWWEGSQCQIKSIW